MERQALHEKIRLGVLATCLIALLSLVSVSVFQSDFKISIAIILLPVVAVLIDGFPLLPVSLLSALGVFSVRVVVEWLVSDGHSNGAAAYWPEIFFYMGYGVLLWSLLRWAKAPYGVLHVVALVAIDLVANLLELFFRGTLPTGQMLLQLLAVAACRSICAAALIWAFSRYGFKLLRREDSHRYQRLLLLTARLKGDLVWLQKGERQIEETMSLAYSLYHRMKQRPGEDGAQDALTIAKDIHEIKKEYMLIVRGIRESLEEDKRSDAMTFGALYDILTESMGRWAKEWGGSVRFCLAGQCDLVTPSYEYLLSIFHNLYQNAVEAGNGKDVEIRTVVEDRGGSWRFQVSDNCGGISSDSAEQVFLPGFSTKFDQQTGDIQRGLGLTIVRDLVEEQLEGSISVSTSNTGATFTVEIPKHTLEERKA